MTRTPVSALRNLGPAVEAACAQAGIHSAEELRALGADAAYRRLLAAGTRAKANNAGCFVWGDSTNADRPGVAPSESSVGPALLEAFSRCRGRIRRPRDRSPDSLPV